MNKPIKYMNNQMEHEAFCQIRNQAAQQLLNHSDIVWDYICAQLVSPICNTVHPHVQSVYRR